MKKIIFLLTLVLITGLGCFAQDDYIEKTGDNLIPRYKSLPVVDPTESVDSTDLSEWSDELPNEEVVNTDFSDNVNVDAETVTKHKNPTRYVGKEIWINTSNEEVYEIDIITDKPNTVIIRYYSTNNCFVRYPYATPIFYSGWYNWPVYRYSSWDSFHCAYPSFYFGVNYHCNNVSYNNYGYSVNLRDHYYGRRYGWDNYGGNNHGGYKNSNNFSSGGYKQTGTYNFGNNQNYNQRSDRNATNNNSYNTNGSYNPWGGNSSGNYQRSNGNNADYNNTSNNPWGSKSSYSKPNDGSYNQGSYSSPPAKSNNSGSGGWSTKSSGGRRR